ncbi:hypothetical protein HDU89_000660 [Geranomyces variabilis]|nr:hypothetical protein HDU89_000660 [Geranomyces variabilis]
MLTAKDPEIRVDLALPAAAIKKWAVYAKARHALPDGQRLENLSWRLMHKQLAKNPSPLSPAIEFSAEAQVEHHELNDGADVEMGSSENCLPYTIAQVNHGPASFGQSLNTPPALEGDALDLEGCSAVAVSDIFPVSERIPRAYYPFLPTPRQTCDSPSFHLHAPSPYFADGPVNPLAAQYAKSSCQSMLPVKQTARRASQTPGYVVPSACYNCGTDKTPLWRRDPNGEPICNACGLFYRLHRVARPISLKKDVLRRRNRKKDKSKEAEEGLAVSVPVATSTSPSILAPLQIPAQPQIPQSTFTGNELATMEWPAPSSASPHEAAIITRVSSEQHLGALNQRCVTETTTATVLDSRQEESPVIPACCAVADKLMPPSPCPPLPLTGKRRRGDSDAPMYPLPTHNSPRSLSTYTSCHASSIAHPPATPNTSKLAAEHVVQQPHPPSATTSASAPSPAVLRRLLQQFIDLQTRNGTIPPGVDIAELLRGLETLNLRGPAETPLIKTGSGSAFTPQQQRINYVQHSPTSVTRVCDVELQQHQYHQHHRQSAQRQPSNLDSTYDLSMTHSRYPIPVPQHMQQQQRLQYQQQRAQLHPMPFYPAALPAPHQRSNVFCQPEPDDFSFSRSDYREIGHMWSCEEPFGSLTEAFVDRAFGFKDDL